MPGGNKKPLQTGEDLCFFEFSTNTSNYVVQSNTLICGKQSLKINSMKIIRAAIMQVVRDDVDLKPYIISIQDIAKLLNISSSNLYRDIDQITDDIMKNPVHVRQTSGSKTRWVKIPWVKRCEYNSDRGLLIKLNEELKPYLINLREYYAQYPYELIVNMKSSYAIRIFELLQSKIMIKQMPLEGLHIIISMKELRETCSCENRLLEFSNFRIKVLEKSKEEIEKNTSYVLKYAYIKQGRQVTGIDFYINISYHMGPGLAE